jgi:hypothetical protein
MPYLIGTFFQYGIIVNIAFYSTKKKKPANI